MIDKVQNWSNVIISYVIQDMIDMLINEETWGDDDRRWQTMTDDDRRWQTMTDDGRQCQKMSEDVRRCQTWGDDDRRDATMIWLGSLVFNFIINKAVVRLVWSLSLV